ncbi:hypothetical protein Drorol1_Dr00003955 [Drosera rotundifolia]
MAAAAEMISLKESVPASTKAMRPPARPGVGKLGMKCQAIHARKLKSIRRKKGSERKTVIVAMMLSFLGVAFESILKPPGGYRQGELPQAGDPIVGEGYIKYSIAVFLFLVVTALTYALSKLQLASFYILHTCTITVCVGATYIFLFLMAFQARGVFPGLWVVVFKVLPYGALAAIFVLWVGTFCYHLLKRTPNVASDIEQIGARKKLLQISL